MLLMFLSVCLMLAFSVTSVVTDDTRYLIISLILYVLIWAQAIVMPSEDTEIVRESTPTPFTFDTKTLSVSQQDAD